MCVYVFRFICIACCVSVCACVGGSQRLTSDIKVLMSPNYFLKFSY